MKLRGIIPFKFAIVVISFLFIQPAPIYSQTVIEAPPKARANESNCRVEKATDGDTFLLSDGRQVRLLGIDTPEKGEPYYDSARHFADSLLSGRAVRLEFDREREDKYGRVLAYVFTDTILYNELALRQGLARVYLFKSNSRFEKKLIAAQKEARTARRNIWSLPEPDPEPYYIAPGGSLRFHRPLCPNIKNINMRKAKKYPNRDGALDQGLSPCRSCRP